MLLKGFGIHINYFCFYDPYPKKFLESTSKKNIYEHFTKKQQKHHE